MKKPLLHIAMLMFSFVFITPTYAEIIAVCCGDPVPDEDAVYVTISGEVPLNPSGALATDFHIEAFGDSTDPVEGIADDYGTVETLAYQRASIDLFQITGTTGTDAFSIDDGLDGPGVLCFFFWGSLSAGEMFEVTIPVTFDYFDENSHANAQHVSDANASFGSYSFSYADGSTITGPRQALDFSFSAPAAFENNSELRHTHLDVFDDPFEFKVTVVSEPSLASLVVTLSMMALWKRRSRMQNKTLI